MFKKKRVRNALIEANVIVLPNRSSATQTSSTSFYQLNLLASNCYLENLHESPPWFVEA